MPVVKGKTGVMQGLSIKKAVDLPGLSCTGRTYPAALFQDFRKKARFLRISINGLAKPFLCFSQLCPVKGGGFVQ